MNWRRSRKFASDLDEATRKQLQHGEVVTELMKQKQFSTLNTAEMALTLWHQQRFLRRCSGIQSLAFEAEFLSFVRTQHPEVLEAINASGAMSDESEKALTEAMKSFKSSYAYQA